MFTVAPSLANPERDAIQLCGCLPVAVECLASRQAGRSCLVAVARLPVVSNVALAGRCVLRSQYARLNIAGRSFGATFPGCGLDCFSPLESNRQCLAGCDGTLQPVAPILRPVALVALHCGLSFGAYRTPGKVAPVTLPGCCVVSLVLPVAILASNAISRTTHFCNAIRDRFDAGNLFASGLVSVRLVSVRLCRFGHNLKLTGL